MLLGLAVPPRFLLGSGYVGRRCDTRIPFGHVFCSTELCEGSSGFSRRATNTQPPSRSPTPAGLSSISIEMPVVFARRGTPGGPIRDEDQRRQHLDARGFGGEVLARSIPPERGLRQPFADGRQRFLTLGPFVARLPVHRQLRIGRCGVLRDGVARGNARPRAARGARYRRRCRQISASGLGRPAGAVCRGPPFSRYRLRSPSTSGTKFGARPMA